MISRQVYRIRENLGLGDPDPGPVLMRLLIYKDLRIRNGGTDFLKSIKYSREGSFLFLTCHSERLLIS
jgi:hypothetical protein